MVRCIILITSLLLTVNAIAQSYRDSHNPDSTLRYSHLSFKEKIHFIKDLLRDDYLDGIEEEELWFESNGFSLYNKLGVGSEVLRVYYGEIKNKTLDSLRNIDFHSIIVYNGSFRFFSYNITDSIDVFGWTNNVNNSRNEFLLYTSIDLNEKYNIQAILNYAKIQDWDKKKLYIFGLLYNSKCEFFYYDDLYVSYLGEIMMAREFFNNVRYSNEFQDFLKSAEDFK